MNIWIFEWLFEYLNIWIFASWNGKNESLWAKTCECLRMRKKEDRKIDGERGREREREGERESARGRERERERISVNVKRLWKETNNWGCQNSRSLKESYK